MASPALPRLLAQVSGPLLSGVLRDWTGNHDASLNSVAALSARAVGAALFVRAPRQPVPLRAWRA